MEAMMMTREELLKFKTLFEGEKRRLIYTQNLINEDFHFQEDDLLDTTDLTSSELERSMRMRLRNREALYMKKIEDALKRISEGTFGECQDCGKPIGIKRLLARPTADFCVLCKEEQETREQQHIDGHRSKSLGAKLRLA
jgi:DnaK suppressor protein